MTDSVRRFITRLGPESRIRLFQHLDLAMPETSDLKPRERDKRVLEALMNASDSIRGRAEAISAHVNLLSDKGEYAERALRAVCRYRAEFLDILESDRSLEERAFWVWLEAASLLDRARNLAMSFHWREGRFHCSFNVAEARPLGEDFDQALGEIQSIVQAKQGGRRVAVDEFTYLDETMSGQLTHHIAVYLEAPASALIEFKEGENTPIPVLRREAREIAIDYNPRTGRLDLAGRGVGGHKTYQQIATSFASFALADAELIEVTSRTWQLGAFLAAPPADLFPPPGFSLVRVTQMVLYSSRWAGGKATVRAGMGQDVYGRMHELGISVEARSLESPYAITLTLEVPPHASSDVGRTVRVTISSKNARSFEGATLNDRRIIEAWLENPPFVAPT